MSNIKVSVIIPVYNVENYLRECLDSIINQTFKDLEIIVVDDDYARCVEIAQKIRELIDNKVYKNSEDNLLFSMIRFFDCVEDTVDDVFVQDMSFQIHVQNISDFLDD